MASWRVYILFKSVYITVSFSLFCCWIVFHSFVAFLVALPLVIYEIFPGAFSILKASVGILTLTSPHSPTVSFKVAQNSFQLFPRRRFWWVIITTLYQLMLQSWCKKLPSHWRTRWYYFRDTKAYHSNTMTC